MSDTAAPAANPVVRVVRDYRDGLTALFDCPREIWVAYALKVLEGLCYFSTVLVLMAFLTQDMGLSDAAAGTVFGVWSAAMSLFMLFVGFVADSMGIKKALLLGLGIALVGRLAITFTTNPMVVYPGLLMLSIGFAYMIPLIAASVKLFSTKKAQKFAYSWYYVVMNVGSALAGLTLDPIRKAVTEPFSLAVGGFTLVVQPTQVIFLVAVVATLISITLTLTLIRGRIPREAYNGLPGDASVHTEADRAELGQQPEPTGPERKSIWTIMKEVGSDKLFWIFLAFMFLLVMVKMIFQYNHALYPLYMERIGLKDWTGKLYSINPIIIIFLVPVVTAITGRMKAYMVIVVGAFVSAASVLFLSLGEAITLIVLFQVTLSLGEALWSPRLYDYTATVAPPGKEASYMALSKVPMFFAKVAAGPATGILLASLCPETGVRNTELMWLIVGISTLLSPVTLVLARRWLDVERRRKMEAV
ncbi:MAG: hypothetical protein CMJ87_13180 [Planctomycetes bacterium]|nr:hypothetical protein [Planctomycetota bacterium]